MSYSAGAGAPVAGNSRDQVGTGCVSSRDAVQLPQLGLRRDEPYHRYYDAKAS